MRRIKTAKAKLMTERERPEDKRDQGLAVGDPRERKGMTRREREDRRRDEGDPRREETFVQRTHREDGGKPPQEGVEMHRQSGVREDAMLEPEQRARERAKESDRELR